MKILQYHPLRDPAFVAVETRALTFLLDLGKAYGEPARWKPNEASYYDQYHTAYCAAIAMLPYYFTHVCSSSPESSLHFFCDLVLMCGYVFPLLLRVVFLSGG